MKPKNSPSLNTSLFQFTLLGAPTGIARNIAVGYNEFTSY